MLCVHHYCWLLLKTDMTKKLWKRTTWSKIHLNPYLRSFKMFGPFDNVSLLLLSWVLQYKLVLSIGVLAWDPNVVLSETRMIWYWPSRCGACRDLEEVQNIEGDSLPTILPARFIQIKEHYKCPIVPLTTFMMPISFTVQLQRVQEKTHLLFERLNYELYHSGYSLEYSWATLNFMYWTVMNRERPVLEWS